MKYLFLSPLQKVKFDFFPFCDGLKSSRNSSLPVIFYYCDWVSTRRKKANSLKGIFKAASFFFCLCLPGTIIAQQNAEKVLTLEAYLDIVQAHHPVAKRADIELLKGAATVMQARGAFDPKAFADMSQKYFKDKEYYSLINGGVKIPTWFGIELKTAFEQNGGLFLNPENNTSGGGLWYAGASISLGAGLFIDKRRAELRRAQLYEEMTQLERQLILNDLLYEAASVYWEWFKAYNTLAVYENALQLATVRFDATKRGAVLGDRPPIDTLEAGIQVQNRRLRYQQAQLDFVNSTALLSVYLWVDGIVPLEVEAGTVPLGVDGLSVLEVEGDLYAKLDSLVNAHPSLQQYQYKLDQLAISRRLKQEQLKPQLDLNYNAIAQPINGDPFAAYSVNNYKWGFSFNMPVFLRKERGALRLADLKIQEATLDFTLKNASISYKIISSFNDWQTTFDQVNLYTQTVEDYRQLLAGERRLFDIGESSLFMVNSRELGYINAQVKLVELLTKNQKAQLATRFAMGLLGNP